jgi:hypothetical protein
MPPVPVRERWLPLVFGCAGIAFGLLSADYMFAALFAAYTAFVLTPAGGRAMVGDARGERPTEERGTPGVRLRSTASGSRTLSWASVPE